MMNSISTKLRLKKLPQAKDRETRTAIANPIRTRLIVRSRGLPSSRLTTQLCPVIAPNHCEGRRDPAKNIQVTGTHKAPEVSRILAGSKHNNAKRSTNQRKSAIGGGMAQSDAISRESGIRGDVYGAVN